MNELTPAQERYIGFVKELVNEGLNRVERMLGVDRGPAVAIEAIAQPAIAAPVVPALSAFDKAIRRPYKKRAKIGRPRKAVVVDEVGAKRRGRMSAPAMGVRHMEARSDEPASPPTSSPKPANRTCVTCGKRPAHGRSDKCIFCIREARDIPSAPRPVPVSVSVPAQSDGLIRSGQRMPRTGVPVGFAECRCGRIRKPDEQVCVVCVAMRMGRTA